ncbi:DUF3127 domain-containing protein [Bermanella sp. R86510]|uniref:DUF3127 domain-containing protein n=1 Tax=unclassified Bermanella TaxID=2627862 RepID=UPI0037CB1542
MSKSFEAQGVIHSIDETREYGQNGFTKREFVMQLTGDGENPAYPNYIALEVIKDKCELMDQYQAGDEVIVHFNLSGRLWNAPGKPEKCFTSLQAWRVERAGAEQPQVATTTPNAPPFPGQGFDDDVPF